VLKKILERAPKQMLIAHDVTVEIEKTARPALVDQDSTPAKAAVASPP
jgi:hypothetical protein